MAPKRRSQRTRSGRTSAVADAIVSAVPEVTTSPSTSEVEQTHQQPLNALREENLRLQTLVSSLSAHQNRESTSTPSPHVAQSISNDPDNLEAPNSNPEEAIVPFLTESEVREIEKEAKKDYGQSIPKFNGEFFLQFKEHMVTWLKMKGLYTHLVVPFDKTRVSDSAYMKTREITKFLLHNTISNKVLQEHPTCRDPYDLWQALSLKYESLNMMEQMKLGVLAASITFSDCNNDIDQYMTKIDTLASRIMAGGGEVTVKEWISWLLIGMDSRLYNFTDTLKSSDFKDIEKFKAKLRESTRNKLQFEEESVSSSGNSSHS
jgi:hypothetical protein